MVHKLQLYLIQFPYFTHNANTIIWLELDN